MKPAAEPPGLVDRKDGRQLRRMTLYLDPDTAHALKVFCATHSVEMSAVATAALHDFLEHAQSRTP